MHQQPLLSICIPTYNRAEHLKRTLESIVRQREFVETSEVEVVISDNCSTDHTQAVAEDFVKTYGDKVKYFRNETNLKDENLKCVLYKSTGDFLKLNNDLSEHLDGSLAKMLSVIKTYQKEKPVLFFMNRSTDIETTICDSLDAFIKEVSFNNTWFLCCGLWRDFLYSEDDLFRYLTSSLAQTDILCRALASGKRAIVCYHEMAVVQPVAKKGGYNIAQVFGYNYLKILKEYVHKGALSFDVYAAEKKHILLAHINHYYFDLNHEYAFQKTGYFKWLWPDYKAAPYFYLAYLKITWLRVKRALFSMKKIKDKDYTYKTITFLGLTLKIKKKRRSSVQNKRS